MPLYYQDDHITLYHGDCLTEHTEWTTADILVTDPPYGMSFQSNHRKAGRLARIEGDDTPEVRDKAVALWGQRPALVFGRWSVPAPTHEVQRLIWWKEGHPGMGDLRIPWGPAHEDIHLLGTGWDVIKTGQKRTGSVVTTRGVRGSSHGAENAYGHPTPKPVPLMESLIVRCPPGVIADPFAGSGATLIAARNLGRKAVGVELEEKYCEIIAHRLDQGVLNLAAN